MGGLLSCAFRRIAKAVDRIPGRGIGQAEEHDGGAGPARRRRRAAGRGAPAHDREDLLELLFAGRIRRPRVEKPACGPGKGCAARKPWEQAPRTQWQVTLLGSSGKITSRKRLTGLRVWGTISREFTKSFQ